VTLEHTIYHAFQDCLVTVIPKHTHTPYSLIASLHNLNNRQCYLMRTLKEGHRHR